MGGITSTGAWGAIGLDLFLGFSLYLPVPHGPAMAMGAFHAIPCLWCWFCRGRHFFQ